MVRCSQRLVIRGIYAHISHQERLRVCSRLIQPRLRPHESPVTDVILLGHSMGGILSAEVALLEGHRIMGTINFDTPFLGMHPGVIASGFGSIFRPAPDTPGQKPTDTRNDSQDSRSIPAGNGEGVESSTSSSYFPSGGTTLIPTETSSTTTLPMSPTMSMGLPIKDPNYDPPFVNDVRLAQRTGWANALHFINKHSDGLRAATTSYVKSHLEFGGAMADYNGLKNRYGKLRALEDVDPKLQTRIRFVNYYTASTGRPKKPKSTPSTAQVSRVSTGGLDGETSGAEQNMQNLDLDAHDARSPSFSPRNSVEEPDEEAGPIIEDDHLGVAQNHTDDEGTTSDASQAMDHMDPAPMTDDEQDDEAPDKDKVSSALQPMQSTATAESNHSKSASITSTNPASTKIVASLPPLPSASEEPAAFDPRSYTDKDTCKLAEKEHSRQVKAYKQAVKDRDKAINDRRKFLEKREKNAAKERERLIKAEEKERLKEEQKGMEKGERERNKQEREEAKRLEKERVRMEKEAKRLNGGGKDDAASASLSNTQTTDDPGEDEEEKPERPKRDKKFCMLPPRINGQIDPCWMRVFMPGVDEVGAHCGLFFVDGERYRKFVGDVAERIEGWVEQSRV